MREQQTNMNEYPESWDDGTYQTGASVPERRNRGLVEALLAMVIFLGGISSALGLMNIRLLMKLQQKQEENALPLSITSETQVTDSLSNMIRSTEEPVPTVPQGSTLRFQMEPKGTRQLSKDEILACVKDSLVTITCDSHIHPRQNSLGVIVDGFILTNASSINHTNHIFVNLSDGTLQRAALVGMDEFSDLAVLYVKREDIPGVALGYGQQTQDAVYAVSDAHTMSLMQGQLEDGVDTTGADFGPVFNGYGQMIGFHVRRIHQGEQMVGMLPNEQMRTIVCQLVEKGKVSGRPSLGIQTQALSKLYQNYWDMPGGLQIIHVEPGSDAQQMGLRIGDVLLELEGQPLREQQDLLKILQLREPGDRLQAAVIRDGRRFAVHLKVEKNP